MSSCKVVLLSSGRIDRSIKYIPKGRMVFAISEGPKNNITWLHIVKRDTFGLVWRWYQIARVRFISKFQVVRFCFCVHRGSNNHLNVSKGLEKQIWHPRVVLAGLTFVYYAAFVSFTFPNFLCSYKLLTLGWCMQ